jgi:transcriptional regulator with XRE-family HTH domain
MPIAKRKHYGFHPGRALLDMTQPQLAELAGLALSTVVDFEKERRQVSVAAVAAIQRALRRAGVEFIDENGGEHCRQCSPRLYG